VCSEALYNLLFIVIVLLLIPILGCLVALSQAFVSDFLFFFFPVAVIELPAAVTSAGVTVLVLIELVVVTTAVVIAINF